MSTTKSEEALDVELGNTFLCEEETNTLYLLKYDFKPASTPDKGFVKFNEDNGETTVQFGAGKDKQAILTGLYKDNVSYVCRHVPERNCYVMDRVVRVLNLKHCTDHTAQPLRAREEGVMFLKEPRGDNPWTALLDKAPNGCHSDHDTLAVPVASNSHRSPTPPKPQSMSKPRTPRSSSKSPARSVLGGDSDDDDDDDD